MSEVPDSVYNKEDLEISMIVAAATNHAIGKDNHLMWHLPNDLKFFKNTTWGFPVIMGRKTFDEVKKPLPGRTNIVISHNPVFSAPGITVTSNLQQAVEKAAETNAKQIFIIGGGEIYRQSMDIAHTIYMTRVHGEFNGDAYFPVIDTNEWELTTNDDFPADDKHAYAYSFQLWQKK